MGESNLLKKFYRIIHLEDIMGIVLFIVLIFMTKDFYTSLILALILVWFVMIMKDLFGRKK